MTASVTTPQRQRGIRLTVAAVLTFVVVVVGSFIYERVRPQTLSRSQLSADGLFLFDHPRDVGDFALTDDNGKPFTPADLRGKWTLLYFGYTYCPDLCPTTMAMLSQFYAKLPPTLTHDTQVAMVSVDPARDTPAKMHEYVHYFNPAFRGVTGEFMALQKFAASLNVAFNKVPGEGENYQINHSGNIVLMGPQGHYRGFFRSPQKLANVIKTYESVRRSE